MKFVYESSLHDKNNVTDWIVRWKREEEMKEKRGRPILLFHEGRQKTV
jgi:hypothetical protein